jgi:hypothetical protein
MKSTTRPGCCSHIGSVVAMLVAVVALNALSLSGWVRHGRLGRVDWVDPGSCESENVQGSRHPVERASYESERGRGRPVCIRAWPRSVYPCGWSLNSVSLRRFSGHGFFGSLHLLIVVFGYP